MKIQIEKSFPADTALDYRTFLNDTKIDAELYAYLLSISYGEKGRTIVMKKDVLSFDKLAKEVLHYRSRSTVGNHLNYLKEQEYIIDKGDRYELMVPEKFYFKMPLDLLNFFVNTLKEPVLKTYIYLGNRHSYKPGEYEFTIKELCEHLGMSYNHAANRRRVIEYLTVLSKLGLVEYTTIKDSITFKRKLMRFSTEVPTIDGEKVEFEAAESLIE